MKGRNSCDCRICKNSNVLVLTRHYCYEQSRQEAVPGLETPRSSAKWRGNMKMARKRMERKEVRSAHPVFDDAGRRNWAKRRPWSDRNCRCHFQTDRQTDRRRQSKWECSWGRSPRGRRCNPGVSKQLGWPSSKQQADEDSTYSSIGWSSTAQCQCENGSTSPTLRGFESLSWILSIPRVGSTRKLVVWALTMGSMLLPGMETLNPSSHVARFRNWEILAWAVRQSLIEWWRWSCRNWSTLKLWTMIRSLIRQHSMLQFLQFIARTGWTCQSFVISVVLWLF